MLGNRDQIPYEDKLIKKGSQSPLYQIEIKHYEESSEDPPENFSDELSDLQSIQEELRQKIKINENIMFKRLKNGQYDPQNRYDLKRKIKQNSTSFDARKIKIGRNQIFTTSIIRGPNSNYPKLLLNKMYRYLRKNPDRLEPHQKQQLMSALEKLAVEQFQTINLTHLENIFSQNKNHQMNRRFLHFFLTQSEFRSEMLKSKAISIHNKYKYLVNTKLSVHRCRSKNLVGRIQI